MTALGAPIDAGYTQPELIEMYGFNQFMDDPMVLSFCSRLQLIKKGCPGFDCGIIIQAFLDVKRDAGIKKSPARSSRSSRPSQPLQTSQTSQPLDQPQQQLSESQKVSKCRNGKDCSNYPCHFLPWKTM